MHIDKLSACHGGSLYDIKEHDNNKAMRIMTERTTEHDGRSSRKSCDDRMTACCSSKRWRQDEGGS